MSEKPGSASYKMKIFGSASWVLQRIRPAVSYRTKKRQRRKPTMRRGRQPYEYGEDEYLSGMAQQQDELLPNTAARQKSERATADGYSKRAEEKKRIVIKIGSSSLVHKDRTPGSYKT